MSISVVPNRFVGLREVSETDEPFLFDVFCTMLADQVAALPDPRLVQHFLRIQFCAQEARFDSRFPGHERFVVTYAGQDAGRAYLHRTTSALHGIDLTLLPRFRSRGIGNRLVLDLFAEARETARIVSIRVPRLYHRATRLFTGLGFRLVTADDLDRYYEWSPATAPV